jgi:hypothetical protein
MHYHMLAPIVTAQQVVDQESEQLRSEQSALSTFREKVAACQASEPMAQKTPSANRPLLEQQRHSQHEEILAAYRETVMDLPHYDTVYGNVLQEDLSFEFNPDIATGLCNKAPFTNQFKSHLLGAIDTSLESREVFLEELDEESQSLSRAHTELSNIIEALSQMGTSSIEGISIQSAPVEAKYEEIIIRRQDQLQSRANPSYIKKHTLCEYLYDEPGWTYPVLHAAAMVGKDLRAVNDRQISPTSQSQP